MAAWGCCLSPFIRRFSEWGAIRWVWKVHKPARPEYFLQQSDKKCIERVRAGYTLIEVVIGLLIASLLSIVLYRMFSQTVRIASLSSELIEEYSDSMIAANQLERDITSIVVLKEHTMLAEQQAATQQAADQSNQQQGGSKPSIDLAENPSERKDEQKESEAEQLAFSGVIKDNKLSSLSFVCTNALPQVDKAGSRLVRVRYFLVPDPNDSTLSQLMREERQYQARSAPGEQPSKSHAYVVMPHIVSLSVQFYGTVYGKKQESRAASSSSEEAISLSSWGNEEQRKKLKRLVPEYLEITGECRGRQANRTVPFAVSIPIPAGIAEGIEAREKEQREQGKGGQEKHG